VPAAFVSVTEFTSTEVNLLVSGKTQPSDQWAVTSEMRRRIFAVFEKKKIRLGTAFPALAPAPKK
jgi:small-conductance mechanosensitive channel